MYADGEGLYLYDYTKSLIDKIILYLDILNISDHLDRGTINFLLVPGDHIFVQGAHTFMRQNNIDTGTGQSSLGCRRANGVRVEFIFDRWEATSVSCHGWLSGREVVGSIIKVRSMERKHGEVRISGTVLGISGGFSDLKTREYSPRYNVFSVFGEDEIDMIDDEGQDVNELPF